MSREFYLTEMPKEMATDPDLHDYEHRSSAAACAQMNAAAAHSHAIVQPSVSDPAFDPDLPFDDTPENDSLPENYNIDTEASGSDDLFDGTPEDDSLPEDYNVDTEASGSDVLFDDTPEYDSIEDEDTNLHSSALSRNTPQPF